MKLDGDVLSLARVLSFGSGVFATPSFPSDHSLSKLPTSE